MTTIKIKEINKYLKDLEEPASLVIPEAITESYPEIIDESGQVSDVNFTSDYQDLFNEYDRYFVKHYGEMSIDLESSDMEDVVSEWYSENYGVFAVYLQNWARLYYALSLQYNPLYNVDGTETHLYGQHEEEFTEGQRQHIEGAKQNTIGSRTDTSTNYSVSYDAATEKEDGKTEDVSGQQINNEATYTNTDTHAKDVSLSKTHTDTVTRKGNIGVTKSTDLLRDEFRLRMEKAFFDVVFKTIIEEIGAYWED